MIQTRNLSPGVTLRYYHDTRFKQGRLSLQFLQPMARETAAANALIPAVLLRGTKAYPDLRAITMHLDDLYGATVSDVVRRQGDHQAVGFCCSFADDRFALSGDQILAPVVDFLRQLLLDPLTEDGVFRRDFVEREKEARIRDIESVYDDKPLYAMNCLLETMCQADSFGIPRLGTAEQVEAITAESLWQQYQKLLHTSPVECFYVGSAPIEQVAALVTPVFAGLDRKAAALPPQTPFRDGGPQRHKSQVDTAQSILTMGFVTPVVNGDPCHAAMRVLNLIFGSGMTSKLFMNVREKLSLCYSIGSDYYGAKGIVTICAGIDGHQEQIVRAEILSQLELCRRGEITDGELRSAQAALLSGLGSVHDSPAAIENYYSSQAHSSHPLSVEEYRAAVEAVTAEDVAAAAQTLEEHSVFFLKGASQ